MNHVLSSELSLLFSSLVYITPVLGAYVADVYLGRYRTILVFCLVYVVGLLLTTAGAFPTDAGAELMSGEGSSGDEGGSGENGPSISRGLAQAREYPRLVECLHFEIQSTGQKWL